MRRRARTGLTAAGVAIGVGADRRAALDRRRRAQDGGRPDPRRPRRTSASSRRARPTSRGRFCRESLDADAPRDTRRLRRGRRSSSASAESRTATPSSSSGCAPTSSPCRRFVIVEGRRAHGRRGDARRPGREVAAPGAGRHAPRREQAASGSRASTTPATTSRTSARCLPLPAVQKLAQRPGEVTTFGDHDRSSDGSPRDVAKQVEHRFPGVTAVTEPGAGRQGRHVEPADHQRRLDLLAARADRRRDRRHEHDGHVRVRADPRDRDHARGRLAGTADRGADRRARRSGSACSRSAPASPPATCAAELFVRRRQPVAARDARLHGRRLRLGARVRARRRGDRRALPGLARRPAHADRGAAAGVASPALDPAVADPERPVGELGDVVVVRDEQDRHPAPRRAARAEARRSARRSPSRARRSARPRAGAAARSRAPARSRPAGAPRRRACSASAFARCAIAQSSSSSVRPRRARRRGRGRGPSSAPGRSRARSASGSGGGTGTRSRRSPRGTRTVAKLLEPLAADDDRARVRPVERADQVQQRALAAARRAGRARRSRPARAGSETSSSAWIRPSSNDFETWSTTTSTPPFPSLRRDLASEHLRAPSHRPSPSRPSAA